ncbi:MAG: T9SS type A sorting domain-containing protein [Bacteroidota bacterium]
MRFAYRFLALAAVCGLAWAPQAVAQDFTTCPTDQDECLVEWADPVTFAPIINGLRNTIANDENRPAGRVYVLRRGGFYYNTDRLSNEGFDLRVIGQTAEEGAASGENVCGDGTQDCGPAIIQRFTREDGSVDQRMIESGGDGNSGLVLKNVWIMGVDNNGGTTYHPININSSNSRFEFDNVVFDRNNWQHVGVPGGGNSFYITNSFFRNISGNSQIFEGRGIRFEAGADTVVFENNTFFNLTSFPFQSEAAPVEYFLFNHNTLVNFGREFSAGTRWKKAYVANNIMVNPYFQGESPDQFQDRLDTWVAQGNAPEDIPTFVGVFSVGALNSSEGLEVDRRILLSNNATFQTNAVTNAQNALSLTGQPLVGDSTQSFFDTFDGMVAQNNVVANPGFASSTTPLNGDVDGQINTFLNQWIGGEPTPWAYVYWDPGRPPIGDALHPVSNVWPPVEDFSYSNSDLQTAGTDGLPLGDLNWYPSAKDTYLANRAQFVQDLEDTAGPPVVQPIGQIQLQAEDATVFDNATVQSFEGFASYVFESSGSVVWTFDVPSNGEYGLNVLTDLRGSGERGQTYLVNGNVLRNTDTFGEYFVCATGSGNGDCVVFVEPGGFDTLEIRESDLNSETSGNLTLSAGTQTLEIQPGWGFQAFSTVEVVDASGNVVATLTPPDATASGVSEACEGDVFCPSGFQSALIEDGGSVSWSVDVQSGVRSGLLRLFYQAPTGATGSVSVNGTEVATASFSSAGGTSASEAVTIRFTLGSGANTITLATSGGAVDLDQAILLVYDVGSVANEDGALPEGYALGQNFPNPFAQATSIQYQLGETAEVALHVYDLLGRKVMTLVDGEMPAGSHSVNLDASRLASGTYIYRIETPVGMEVRKMVVVN